MKFVRFSCLLPALWLGGVLSVPTTGNITEFEIMSLPIPLVASGLPPMNQTGERVPVITKKVDAAEHLERRSGSIFYTPGKRVLTGDRNVYLAFYGTWDISERKIVEDFVSGLSTSSWWRVIQQYYYEDPATKRRTFVGRVRWAGSAVDSYSQGNRLNGLDATINVVKEMIRSRKLPDDSEGMYLVLTSKDVRENGWHHAFGMNGKTYYYGFAGNPGDKSWCPHGCNTMNHNKSPNNNPGVDTMISQVAHEIVEIISNPIGGAWETSSGAEIADVCAYQYGGANLRSRNGYNFNMGFNNRAFLVQWVWSPNSRNCRFAP